MAGWNFTEVGISVKDDDRILKQQFMDCIGLEKIYGNDFSDERCSAAGEEIETLYEDFFKDNSMIFGEHPCHECLDEVSLNKIFALLNIVFPRTYLNAQHYSGSTVTCERDMIQFLIDPNNMIIIKSACGEDESEYANPPKYCDCSFRYLDKKTGNYVTKSIKEFKQELRKLSEEANPNGFISDEDFEKEFEMGFRDYFYDFIADPDGDITVIWEGRTSCSYTLAKLEKNYIREVIEKSTEKGYTELTALLNEKCKDILES